jgi:hypothetical protein
MTSMYCSRCAAPQPMNQSISEQEVTGPGGEIIRLTIQTYHCAICKSFVSSESVHDREDEVAA